MNTKISCVLLVDDSHSTNFYHKKVIEVSSKVECIQQVENGLEALNYIQKKGKFTGDYPKPNLILLDINMPVMDGFEFLENYAKLSNEQKKDTMVVIVSTSNWKKDIEKAKSICYVDNYYEKSISKEVFKEISANYSNYNFRVNSSIIV